MEGVIKNTPPAPAESVVDDLLMAKIIAMTVLGVASFLLGILPIKLAKQISLKSVDGDKNLVISLLLCFGGGVLLFTTFIHLQPEVRESFSSLEEQGLLPDIGKVIPFSELVFCIGFFFVYLIEELVHLYLDRKIHSASIHQSLSITRRSSKKSLSLPTSKLDGGTISYISTSDKELFNSQTTINLEKHSHNHHIDESIKNSFSGFLAVLALSLHAVFEGLAVGLEGSVEKVWYLFVAIATHKLVIGFCVGMELVISKTKVLLVMLYIGIFAIVSPLGIGVGIILSDKSANSENVTTVVLQGMAAGTLVYVVFFEVFARERNNRHSGVCQLLAILTGFTVMLMLQFLTGHEHSHGGEHAHHHHAEAHANLVEATTRLSHPHEKVHLFS